MTNSWSLLSSCLCSGKWKPGKGECRLEEGGEAADGGGQVSDVCAEQPRASVHRPGPSDPWPPVSSSSQQLPPPAHRCITLPALTSCAANRWLTSTESERQELRLENNEKAHFSAKRRQCGTQTVTYCIQSYLFRFSSSSCPNIIWLIISVDPFVNLNVTMSRISNQSMFTMGEKANLLYVKVTQRI